MNLMNPKGRQRPTTRRQRFASVAVEAMEKRLTLSRALPLPPTIAANVVANFKCVLSMPNDPYIPSGPCISNGPPASQLAGNIPTGPCIPVGPPASQLARNLP
jgi:hypothetical protein